MGARRGPKLAKRLPQVESEGRVVAREGKSSVEGVRGAARCCVGVIVIARGIDVAFGERIEREKKRFEQITAGAARAARVAGVC